MSGSAVVDMAPEVVFYVLASHHVQQRLQFACKLIEKAYRSGQSAYLLTDSPEQAALMNQQLWTFRSGSFVPHELYQPGKPALAQTILIGGAPIPEARQRLVVNLSALLPEPIERLEKILEIIDSNEPVKSAGRQRYRTYQQYGCAITTHNV